MSFSDVLWRGLGALRLSKRRVLRLVCALVAVGGFFYISLNRIVDGKGSGFVISDSGLYLIENVPVRGALVPFDNLAYLRVTDIQDSHTVFRSPLYTPSDLDMRMYEDDAIVGIVWLDFYKQGQHFGIRFPDWKEHWINKFISNTSYEVFGED